MGRVWITGDTHGSIDIGKLNSHRFPVQFGMTKEDVLIIAGDVGVVWDNSKTDLYWRNWLSEKNFTTLCCLGNHENYNAISEFPITEKFGGQVREIAPSLFYAVGGEIYTLNGKTYLFINGADSHDKAYRTENKSWWAAEQISAEQIERAKANVAKYNNKVDYVISHTGGIYVAKTFNFKPTISDERLTELLFSIEYSHHWCGHYHVDVNLNKTTVLYRQITEIIDQIPYEQEKPVYF